MSPLVPTYSLAGKLSCLKGDTKGSSLFEMIFGKRSTGVTSPRTGLKKHLDKNKTEITVI